MTCARKGLRIIHNNRTVHNDTEGEHAFCTRLRLELPTEGSVLYDIAPTLEPWQQPSYLFLPARIRYMGARNSSPDASAIALVCS